MKVEFECGYSVQPYLSTVGDVMSTLRTTCIETKQPNFNRRTFSLTDIEVFCMQIITVITHLLNRNLI